MLIGADWPTLVYQLLAMITSLPAAYSLYSAETDGLLIHKINSLQTRLFFRYVDINHFTQLMKFVINRVDGIQIWTELYKVIARTAPSTTPPPSSPAFQQTPWTFTSSVIDSYELRNNMDPLLKAELNDYLTISYAEFVDAFFGKIAGLKEIVNYILMYCETKNPPLYQKNIGWLGWPEECAEKAVFQWLQEKIDEFLRLAEKGGLEPQSQRRCFFTPAEPLPGFQRHRKLDIGIGYGSSHGAQQDWSQILVIGELKSNSQEDHHRNTLLDLARYAREIFGAQDRRFVLGFTLCGSKLRAWEFDRLGGTASASIDVHMDAKAFVKVMLGFFLMTEKQLGLDPSIYNADGRCFIKIARNDLNETLQLTRMKKRSGIAGRATTCWKALRNPNQSGNHLVIKDSWQSKERPEEGLLLKLVTEKGVRNVSRYFHHETVQFDGKEDDVLNSVRQGLICTNGKEVFEEDDADSQTSRDSLNRAFIATQGLNFSQKRELSSNHSSSSMSRKRSRLMRPIHDRVHRRVITQDAGIDLYQATSLSAFLQGLIGGINGASLLSVTDLAD